jgi:hypothetical protein
VQFIFLGLADVLQSSDVLALIVGEIPFSRILIDFLMGKG